jgi:hypothetical protein
MRQGLLFLLTLATVCSARGSEAAPDVVTPKVHAVFIFDTRGRGIGPMVQMDRWNVLRSFHGGFRDAGQEQLLVWSVLESQDAHPQAVLQAIAALRPSPQDTVLVYYAGHGAIDASRGHYLNMSSGRLHRSTVQAAMRKHQVRLSVLITESCAVVEPSREMRTSLKPGGPPTGNWQTLSKLLFEAQGTVDLNTSCPNQVAAAAPDTGAFFTHCLADVLCRPPSGDLTWEAAVTQAERALWRMVPRRQQETYVYALDETRGAARRTTEPVREGTRWGPGAPTTESGPQSAWRRVEGAGYPAPQSWPPAPGRRPGD